MCVVGLGLIGGSVLRAAHRAGWTVWGATAAPDDHVAAASDGVDVESTVDAALQRAAAQDALVLLAVPLPAVDDVLAQVARHAPSCRLTDVVGVQGPVTSAVRRRIPDARYVGGHPMAGTSASGWAAGSAGLFDGAAWVLDADDGADLGMWADVARLALDCGAHVVPATAADHDAAVARVSHLPHVLAAVLASVGADGGPLALALGAGSFGDGTRVAGSRPDLVRAMCEGNRAALTDALDDALGRLGAARGSLASTGSLESTLRAGHLARRAFEATRDGADDGTLRVDLTGDTALERLREIGRAGGRVTALHGTRCTVTL
ncbi:MAG: prephenate dehydrogenase [Pseudonocardiaceae bacterium]|nr:prephenate dehydrogenase [Pseudonocardiaceae bacterium]